MSRRLHVCYVESGYPHPHGGGGAGTYVQLVGRELVRRGHRVSVVAARCPRCPHRAEDNGVTVYRPKLQVPLHWYLSKIPGLRVGALALRYLEHGYQLYCFLEDLHRIHPIDIIEFTEGGDFWHGFRSRIPFVAHLHGSRYTVRVQSGHVTNQADWFYRRLELVFIRCAQAVVSPSQAMLDIVRREAGRLDVPAWMIPLPIDPKLVRPREPENLFQHERKIVLFAARNDPVKGTDVLLRAIPLVCRRVPKVEFRFFGCQPDPNQRLPDSVTWSPFVPRQELLAQYHQSDLVVVPSRWDNSPNTVYEAMAAGKAVVASKVGGIPELVVDGKTGLLVPPGNAVALAEALIELLLNNQRRCAMGSAGRDRIQHLAGLDVNVQRRLDIYVEIAR